jgi:hypothetical protein
MITIPLSQIRIDWAWNARHVARDKTGRILSAEDLEGLGNHTSLDDLAASIGDLGVPEDAPDPGPGEATALVPVYRASNPHEGYRQHTPIVVRVLADDEHDETRPWEKYTVVAGFTRCEAVKRVAEARGDSACVKAVILAGSPLEARALNLSENAARQSLSTADLVHGVRLYLAELRAARKTDLVERVANVCGKQKAYALKLTRTAMYLSPAVLERWRTSTARVGLDTMARIAELPPEDHEAEFVLACKGTPPQPRHKNSKRARQWVQVVSQKARVLGSHIAAAELDGAITVHDPQLLAKSFVMDELGVARITREASQEALADERVLAIKQAFLEGYKKGKV